jgi:hypothetical protein
MRKILAAFALLTCLPAFAHNTKPGDVVQVEAMAFNDMGDTTTSHKLYTRPWSQIKIDATTVRAIDAIFHKYRNQTNSTLETKYRFLHLTLVDNRVQRALLLTEYGTVLAVDLTRNGYCYVTVAGNGGVGSACE